MIIAIVPATEAHLKELAVRMRPEDRAEITGLGSRPLRTLRTLWADSDTPRAALVDGVVAAVWGCCGSPLETEGRPWLFTTAAVERAPVRFFRQVQAEVAEMLATRRRLQAYGAADYSRSTRFFRALGFQFGEPVPIGVAGQLYRPMWIDRDAVEALAERQPILIRQCSIADLEACPNAAAILAEYAAESSASGLPNPKAKVETYRALHASGTLHVIGAFDGEQLAGYICILFSELPHYSVPVAITESFFVARSYRRTGAGTKLRKAAEALATELGSPGIIVSAPCGGALSRILPRVGYAEKSLSFFKSFATSEVAKPSGIPSMREEDISKVRTFEDYSLANLEQQHSPVSHVIHGGMYARTIKVAPGMMITGALIKVATILIISGDVQVYLGARSLRVTGYQVLPAAAFRKQAFATISETHITMVFPTGARTVEGAEDEFTDELQLLASRKPGVPNLSIITGGSDVG